MGIRIFEAGQNRVWLRLAYKISLQGGGFRLISSEMKLILLIALTAAAGLSVSCNTFIGLGRDMRIAGEGMEKTANKSAGGENTADTSGAPVY